MKQNIKYVIFDLDKTLFNHVKGERMGLERVFGAYYKEKVVDFNSFHSEFSIANATGWKNYEKGECDVKCVLQYPFIQLCNLYRVNNDLNEIVNLYTDVYVKYCTLFEGVDAILNHLVDSGINLAICTNGFEKVQGAKIVYHGIKNYFSHFFYGSKAPLCKPHRYFFNIMINALQVNANQILFIGDSLENDIYPARNAGMNVLYIDNNCLVGEKLMSQQIIHYIKNIIV